MRGIRRLAAVVNPARCTGCGLCAAECPRRAIVIRKIAHIDAVNCVGCGLCVKICPQEALTLKPR